MLWKMLVLPSLGRLMLWKMLVNDGPNAERIHKGRIEEPVYKTRGRSRSYSPKPRLKYICNKEGVKTNSTALTALVEYTECDIRSCLNTLQFLNKKKETLNVLELKSQVVGKKDASKSAFDIWKEIFQKRIAKREKKYNNSFQCMSNDFESLHYLISNR
ncbi:chromosome transmission fidelity protein 18 homolog [Ipomoea triloba]|uniref:chromosome transmission fidelity protein 18 homolog n=1 Tax=Ipomoea triloba TaxID=35885 RepID=UPI00125D6A06|nr:chromosome transmission fidelity protein 18 homolog [Ipomoea triloba]